MQLLEYIFWICLFLIFWANVGYPVSLLLLDKLQKKTNHKLQGYEPTVTVMVVAHNEESVIAKKLDNLLQLDYPKDKLSIIVTSDNSMDGTNDIVRQYAKKHSIISLYCVKERKGKTNAQNEASRYVSSEILVMTDANAILKDNAVRELVSSFIENVAYVAGRLIYSNKDASVTSTNENIYWDMESRIREIESNVQTITAGNGALYAIRTKDYVDFNPMLSHDSAMPLYYNLRGFRAISNHDAIAFEKAGENNKDEFKRKVRMSRITLQFILPSIKILNFFKYKWFTYFYLGHRSCRYLLWFNHSMVIILAAILKTHSAIYSFFLCTNIFVLFIVLFKVIFNIKNKLISMLFYYFMTVFAQFVGVFKTIFGKNKPFWEKASTTR